MSRTNNTHPNRTRRKINTSAIYKSLAILVLVGLGCMVGIFIYAATSRLL
jgi:hypothetical protein